ncbi:MAG: hypothetical protein GOVbin2917_147 [Prokaryotic dsDNA virus sp.]|jgi:hypothetical protein|nr:MAG: hypothetical protein GOVbin2917_147 [Prokaryotic dsDNA virus sp.]
MEKVTRSEFDLLLHCGGDCVSKQSNTNLRGRHLVLMLNGNKIRVLLLEENTNGYFIYEEDSTLYKGLSFLEQC